MWQSAEVLGNFIQRIPSDGAPASEPTEVRVLYTNEALYVGAWLWDSEPGRIVDGEAIRNAPLDDSDAVLFVFDAFADRQNGFVFGTNPSGIEFDAQVTDEGRGSVQGTGRGGGSGRLAGFSVLEDFAVVTLRFLALSVGFDKVLESGSFDDIDRPSSLATRSINCRATTSSIELDALLTSIPWSRRSLTMTS